MTKKEKAMHYDALQVVTKFNEKFPIGSKVKLRKIGRKKDPQIEVTVRSEGFVNAAHCPVAFFVEISGYHAIEYPFVEYDDPAIDGIEFK